MRERYGAELERHIAQTDPTPGVPWSLADQIRARVSCVVEPDNIYADAAGQCVFYFGCKDLMAHTIDFKQRPPVSMTVPVRGSNVMCQYPSDSVEAKSAEEEFQDARGRTAHQDTKSAFDDCVLRRKPAAAVCRPVCNDSGTAHRVPLRHQERRLR